MDLLAGSVPIELQDWDPFEALMRGEAVMSRSYTPAVGIQILPDGTCWWNRPQGWEQCPTTTRDREKWREWWHLNGFHRRSWLPACPPVAGGQPESTY